MGCIPSKAIARSMSLREELNHGFQSTSVVWEELLTSHTNNDQLLAYICSKKKRTSNLTLPSTDSQTPLGTKYFPDSLDAIPGNSRIPEAKSDPEMVAEFDFARSTRSKSCQILGEKGIFDTGFENDAGMNENKLDLKDRSLTGSRSFHTVEEYDALLERIHKSNTDKGSFEDYLEGLKLQQSSTEDQIDDYIQRPAKADVEQLDNFENDAKRDGKSETGWKRKERAKGLTTLDVPTIEFPAIGRVKQWTPVGGQVYSPGAYVTPKFGSYNSKITPAIEENRGGENAVFSPELVAALEDYMDQLQVEEDSILSHMNEHFVVDEIENQMKIPT